MQTLRSRFTTGRFTKRSVRNKKIFEGSFGGRPGQALKRHE